MFTSVGSALFIKATTAPFTVNVYLFSGQVACSAIASPNGWATGNTIPAGTKYIEISLVTPAPGSYPINMLGPAYSPFAIMPNGTDTAPTGGTITTTQYTAMTSIAGCFNIQYGANKLTGTFFNPTFCPNGMEP